MSNPWQIHLQTEIFQVKNQREWVLWQSNVFKHHSSALGKEDAGEQSSEEPQEKANHYPCFPAPSTAQHTPSLLASKINLRASDLGMFCGGWVISMQLHTQVSRVGWTPFALKQYVTTQAGKLW